MSSPPANAELETTNARGSAVLTEDAVGLLRKNHRWMNLLGTIASLATASMILAGVAVLVGARSNGLSNDGHGLLILATIVSLPLAIVYFSRFVTLCWCASAINSALRNRASSDWERALQRYRSFWRYCAITSFLIVVAYGSLVIAIARRVSFESGPQMIDPSLYPDGE